MHKVIFVLLETMSNLEHQLVIHKFLVNQINEDKQIIVWIVEFAKSL